MIDSHAHLHLQDYPDREEVLARADAAGVRAIVVVGADDGIAAAREAVALCESRSGLFATVGVHPHYAASVDDAVLAEVEALLHCQRVVAVGETGLDYYYDHSPREAQVAALRAFLRLAERTAKPAVLHVRDAHAEAAAILREERSRGAIIHCFTGVPDDARTYLGMGCYLSFSGILTFKNAEAIRKAAVEAPADRILVETDCPYLAPVPMRGMRNEPAFVRHVVECLASLRGWSLEQTSTTTADNARRAFRLPADWAHAKLRLTGGSHVAKP